MYSLLTRCTWSAFDNNRLVFVIGIISQYLEDDSVIFVNLECVVIIVSLMLLLRWIQCHYLSVSVNMLCSLNGHIKLYRYS